MALTNTYITFPMVSWSQICGNHVKIPSFVISERNLPNLVDMSQCDYVGASSTLSSLLLLKYSF